MRTQIKHVVQGIFVTLIFILISLQSIFVQAQNHPSCDAKFGGYSVVFSPNGKYLLTSWYFVSLKEEYVAYVLWEVDSSNPLHIFRTDTDPFAAKFSADSSRVAIAADDHISIYEVSTGVKVTSIDSPEDMRKQIYDIAFLSNDTQLLAMTLLNTFVWDIESGNLRKTFRSPGDSHGLYSVVNPNGKYLITGEPQTNNIVVWDIETSSKVKVIESSHPLRGIFSSDSKIAAIQHENEVLIWDIDKTIEHSIVFPSNEGTYSRDRLIQALSHDSKYLQVYVGVRGPHPMDKSNPPTDVFIYSIIEMWNISTGQRIMDFGAFSDNVHGAAFVDSDRILVNYGARFDLWNLKTRHKQISFYINSSVQDEIPTYPVTFNVSPNGNYLISHTTTISVDYSHYISLWDIQTGNKIRTFCLDENFKG